MGRPREFEERITTAARLPFDLHKRATDVAFERDTSVNHLICRALAYYLDHCLPPLGAAVQRDVP